jgi:RHS repeat-associated protein
MRYFLLFLALFLQLNASGYTDYNPQKNCAQTVTDEYGLSHTEGVEPAENITTWVSEEGTFVPAAKITEKQKLSIATNYMGTPEAMYREDGEAVWTCELNSYGRVRNFQGESKTMCPFRYQGQYEDAETGLYYNRFRYYLPEEGMYLSQDPIGFNGGFALYSYVHNPYFWIDPLGLTGIIYLRTDPITGKQYVGKSKSPESFVRRQQAHNRALNKANPELGSKQRYIFEKLETDIKGKQQLSLAEENWIREKGGIAKDGGPLENKIHAMSDENYKNAGGTKNKVKSGCG